MKIQHLISRLTTLAIMAGASSLLAATVTVKMSNDIFTPKAIDINVGDTVTWTNTAGFHTTTDTGLWDSSGLSVGQKFSRTFAAAGTFNYVCTFHVNFGMTGSVKVSAAATPPSVSITSPVNGSVFAAPASFPIQATATSTGGTITNVSFFSSSTLLGSVTQAPFSLNMTALTNGLFSFAAVATDSTGLSATSSVVLVTVATIKLLSPSALPDGGFQFIVEGNVAGKTNLTQASVDFTNWVTFATNSVSGATVIDLASTNFPYRFYRTMELP